MLRNKQFSSPDRAHPFEGDHRFELQHDTIKGPLPFFNPTSAQYNINEPAALSGEGSSASSSTAPSSHKTSSRPSGTAQIKWRSRDNRKGRHALVLDTNHTQSSTPKSQHSTVTFRAILQGLRRMATECPYWDISYLVAVFFSVGCAIFIASGLFYWLPIVAPSSEFKSETTVAGGVTSFVGATLFQVGAILLIFEAVNENQTGCFGWAVEQAFLGSGSREDHDSKAGSQELGSQGSLFDNKHHHAIACHFKPEPDECGHHHQTKRRKRKHRRVSQPASSAHSPKDQRRWQWFASWKELRTHYIHEIGFVASMVMTLGATIFYICGILALPGVYSKLSHGVIVGLYYLSYLLGGVLFVVSSLLYMLETQTAWYKPAPDLLGWHIGLWNLVGSVGWCLAASFGYCTASWCEYQSELTLIWASTAFLIGSMLQWYEALDKYPVEKKKKESTTV